MTTSHGFEVAPPAQATGRPLCRVWILQPRVEHYRTPVFDGLDERGRSGGYELTVLGTLHEGRAFGGEGRAYFRSCPREDFTRFGMALSRWPGARALIARERPDVLVMEASVRNTTAWGLPGLCRELGIPVVGWSKFHSYSKAAPVMGAIKPWFYRRFDRMICYGESSLRELRQMGYPAERVTVAHNTIDTRRIFTDGDRIRARAEAIRLERGLGGRRIMLSIGRMDPDKRHRDLLAAWPRLRRLDPGLTLVLVGSGPLLDEIRGLAAELDADRILVTGRVPEGDDYAWIAAADVCVYPGAVGLAINQSLALGRPTVIADERGADSEILIGDWPQQTGWRYPRGNLDELVRRVERVLTNPDEVAKVCDRGRVLMRDQVTLDRMVDAIHDCVLKALASRLLPCG